MKIRPFLPFLAVLFAAVLPCRAQDASPVASPAATSAPVQDIHVVIHTDKGDIAATLLATHAPVTVANFLNLAQQHFYDGLKFHRVIPQFMIQGGDPAGTGTGGPGYTFDDEPNDPFHFDKAGVLAMANRGKNTNGSQFFITLAETNRLNYLEDSEHKGHYTIFGQVTKGQEVVNAITQDDKIRSVDILDSTVPLFAAQTKHIDQWNAALSKDKAKK